MTTRDVGDRVGLQHLVYDSTGVLTDATVSLAVTDPSGNTDAASVTHASTGTYTADFTLDEAGVWRYVWTVSGTVVDVEDGQITAADPAPLTYISVTTLKAALGLGSSIDQRDELLQDAVVTASRQVERYCSGRRFYLARSASVRVFPVRDVICDRGSERVSVDDIGALDDLLVEVGDGTTWTTITGIETWPDNALARFDPITAIVATNTSIRSNRRLRVTARWGWPEIPAEVSEATKLQAMRLYRRPRSPEGVAGSADWGLVRLPNFDPDFRALLAPFTTPFLAR